MKRNYLKSKKNTSEKNNLGDSEQSGDPIFFLKKGINKIFRREI